MNTHQTGSVAYGIDSYGRCAEVCIKSDHGEATQILRWIKPGAFLMGSPSDEMWRDPYEGPQHQVKLTQGYFLADTACTQGLWQALIGSNPSRFRGDPQLPVEQVSWNDVQEFLRKLEGLLEGWDISLPSESEWEYSCRAGTDTPFSFGARLTLAHANYNGSYPYAGGGTNAYREQTVPVKSFQANAWGLYEMHGNVAEWCADGMRTYSCKAQVDPRTSNRSRRVVRGGSWHGLQADARCAFRYDLAPDSRDSNLGFRFCLR